MAIPETATTGAAAAYSVAGPTGGYCDATTSTSTETIDLSGHAGRYVTIQCFTEQHEISFGGASLTLSTAAAASLTAGVVYTLDAGPSGERSFVVPPGAPHLHYRTATGTGIIRVIPS